MAKRVLSARRSKCCRGRLRVRLGTKEKCLTRTELLKGVEQMLNAAWAVRS